MLRLSEDWAPQQGHIFVQQSWPRVGPNRLFPGNAAASEGLKRLAGAGWNLLPLPAWLNRMTGQNNLTGKMLTAGIATAVYGGLTIWSYATIYRPFNQLWHAWKTGP